MTEAPTFLADLQASRMLGEFPEAEMSMTTSSGPASNSICSAKTLSNEMSFAVAVITLELSEMQIARRPRPQV